MGISRGENVLGRVPQVLPLNHSLVNSQGDRLVGPDGEPDRCISLILSLFPAELQHRIKAAGVEMGDDRARVLHPLVSEGKCIGESGMDYLTFRELELIVFLDEGKATNDEAKRKLKKLRYNTQLSWTANHNLWYPLIRQLQYNYRRQYNSLAIFVDTNRGLHEAMFGKPGTDSRPVQLPTSVTDSEAQAALDHLLQTGRKYEAVQEALKDWRRDNAVKAKSADPTNPPNSNAAGPPTTLRRGQRPQEYHTQKRRAHTPPRVDADQDQKRQKGSIWTIKGGQQSWEKMWEENKDTLPRNMGHRMPRWFKHAAREDGKLCVNCWGPYHGVVRCDATPQQKEKGRLDALAIIERQRQQRQAHQAPPAEPMDVDEEPSQNTAQGAQGAGGGGGRGQQRGGGRGWGDRGRGRDRGRGWGRDRGRGDRDGRTYHPSRGRGR